MKKLTLVLLFLMIIPGIALGGDYVRFDELNVTGSPKMIFRTDRADLTANPALLGEGSNYGFILDTYYLGSTTSVSSDYLNNLVRGANTGYTTGYSDGTYISNGFGRDTGFVMRLNDASTLGFVFNYDFSYMEGNENFFDYWEYPGRNSYGYFYGALERKVKENSFSLAMLYSLAVSDTFSFGTGVEYRYSHEKISDDMDGNGFVRNRPENQTYIDRNTVFDTHLGWRMGVLICYDNNLVENVRITALKGADLLLAPHQTGGCNLRNPHSMGLVDRALWDARKENPEAIETELKGPKGRGWLLRWLPSRAHDNGLFLAFANGVGVDDDEIRTGNAMIIDTYGRILAETWKADDDMVVADLDPALFENCTGRRWLRSRRPELYAPQIGGAHV